MLIFTLFLGKCYAFELDIKNSAGWAAVSLPIRVYPSGTSNIVMNISAGQPFLILGESGNYFEIEYQGKTGYIDSNYCMINLPDVIPSIKYSISNASSSIYRSSGKDIEDITGKQLYDAGKVMNNKIGREEYIVPSLYSTAKMIFAAQELALKDGYSLMIYDSYRPRGVSTLIAQKLSKLYYGDITVQNNINYSYGASGTRYFGVSHGF